MSADEQPDLDLGHGHTLRWTSWRPDRQLNPQFAHLPDVDRYGAIIEHPRPDGTGLCVGGITFDGPVQREHGGTVWTVETWEPLTISPSVLCSCGDHGWIKDGRWIPA